MFATLSNESDSTRFAPLRCVLSVWSHRAPGLRLGISETVAPRTLQALKLLELVGVDGNPAPNFDDLRRAAEEDFQSRLVEHLRCVYADVFSMRDPAQDEVTKIRDAFRHYRPQGMQDRMVRLFLGLCEYGGMIDAVPRVRSVRPRWSFPSAAGDGGRSGHADSATSGTRARRSEYANARRLTTRMSVRRYTRLTNAFLKKVKSAFADDIDYAMLVKLYGSDQDSRSPERRYSPGVCLESIAQTISGDPNSDHISTSFIERQNLTMRMRTWVALDSDTKLVPSYRVGPRDSVEAAALMTDLASRLANRVQLTTDGFRIYLRAVQGAFGNEIDYAQLVKVYGDDSSKKSPERRYSPAVCIDAIPTQISGDPDPDRISTSHVERLNLTTRMSVRRYTRLTNAFSKKVENHVAAVSLHFAHYNFCRVHQTLKTTPAVAAGVTDHVWKLSELVSLLEGAEQAVPMKRGPYKKRTV